VRIGFNDRSALPRAYLRLDRSRLLTILLYRYVNLSGFSGAIRTDTMRYDSDTDTAHRSRRLADSMQPCVRDIVRS